MNDTDKTFWDMINSTFTAADVAEAQKSAVVADKPAKQIIKKDDKVQFVSKKGNVYEATVLNIGRQKGTKKLFAHVQINDKAKRKVLIELSKLEVVK